MFLFEPSAFRLTSTHYECDLLELTCAHMKLDELHAFMFTHYAAASLQEERSHERRRRRLKSNTTITNVARVRTGLI